MRFLRAIVDRRRRLLTIAAVPVLLILLTAESCDDLGGGTSSAAKPGGTTTTTKPGVDAAAYLPKTADWDFPAEDTDLAKWADPIGQGLDLVEAAMDDPDASKIYGDRKIKDGKFTSGAVLSLSAVKCLNQYGHLELRAYFDKRYHYSMALVLVVDTQAYKDVNVAVCALTDLLPFPSRGEPTQSPTVQKPRLEPCVGARHRNHFLVTWLASTDTMCRALEPAGEDLGDRPGLHRGSTGPAVVCLQIQLGRLGYDLTADGQFGAGTEAALNRFQQTHPYSGAIPGVADARTREALQDASVTCS